MLMLLECNKQKKNKKTHTPSLWQEYTLNKHFRTLQKRLCNRYPSVAPSACTLENGISGGALTATQCV